MTFQNGGLYTTSRLPRSDADWQTVAQVVAQKTKPGVSPINVDDVFSVKWTRKPFPWSYYHEFRPHRRFFFHGTSRAVIQKILNEGFRVFPRPAGSQNLLGDGIYVSYHVNKSRRFSPDGYMLSVMVYAPRTYCVHPGQSLSVAELQQIRATYDAIEARSGAIIQGYPLQNHEICIMDPLRTVPRYVIKVS
jgi:hypothetical protein